MGPISAALLVVRIPRHICCCSPRRNLRTSIVAKQLGLSQHVDDPLITNTLAQVEATREAAATDTALVNVVEVTKEQVLPQLEQVVNSLPLLYPENLWMPIVGIAVVVRATHCFISKIRLTRGLERTILHAPWLHKMNNNLTLHRERGNTDDVKEIQQLMVEYKHEHGIEKYHDPDQLDFRGRLASGVLAVFNFTWLTGLTHYYGPLSGAPFLWVPDLALPDPLYALPAVNALLLFVLWRCSRDLSVLRSEGKGMLATIRTNLRKLSLPVTTKNTVFSILGPLNLIGIPSLFLCGYLSDSIPAVMFLYWSASNATAVVLTLALLRSALVRRGLGLLPPHEYRALMNRGKVDPGQYRKQKLAMDKNHKKKLEQIREEKKGEISIEGGG